MNKQQRIVVWIVASVLSAIFIATGAGRHPTAPRVFGLCDPTSAIYIFALPVLLMGAATFVHFMRRKD
jgi:hypothetical protein